MRQFTSHRTLLAQPGSSLPRLRINLNIDSPTNTILEVKPQDKVDASQFRQLIIGAATKFNNHNPSQIDIDWLQTADSDLEFAERFSTELTTQGIDWLIIENGDLLAIDANQLLVRISVELVVLGNTWILISGRELNLEFWREPIAFRLAYIIDEDAEVVEVSDETISTANNPRALLKVDVLSTRVLVNGIEVKNWEGALTKALFFLFLTWKGPITRDEIFEILWPHLSVKEATNVFHVTKRKIGEVIEKTLGRDPGDLTTYHQGFYTLNEDGYEIDCNLARARNLDALFLIATEVEEENQVNAEIIELLHGQPRLVHSLHRVSQMAAYLAETEAEIQKMLIAALVRQALLMKQAGETEQAIGLFARAIGASGRIREDLALDLMRLYVDQKKYQDALAIYWRLQESLRDTLGIAPTKSIQAFAAQIRGQLPN